MANPEFPNQHTTTTTVTTSNTNVQTNLRYDATYVKTTGGMLKVAQIILNLLVFISVVFSRYSVLGKMSFMSGLCGLGFWVTSILLAMYLFHVMEKFYQVPWLKFEFLYTGIWAVFLMIGSTVCATQMAYAAIFGVVSFFGYVNMCVYGFDCFTKFKSIQNGEIAQGTREVSKASPTTPAAY